VNLPAGLTEAYVLQRIDLVVRLLCRNFFFGYFDLDDIKQEGRVEALLALPRYDPGGFDEEGEPRRKLENFLYAHVRNRLLNFYRNKCRRNDPPCPLCHAGRHGEHDDGQPCGKYLAWKRRNDAKANLLRPVFMEEAEYTPSTPSTVESDAEVNEALALLDRKLPAELRSDYLRMRGGEKLPKARRARVEAAVRAALGGHLDGP
jgi:DNA-directed RNA polymerase specialized sigma24 family protein